MSLQVFGIVVAMAVAVTMVWLFDTAPPISFYGSFGVDEKQEKRFEFRAGETLYARRDFRQNRAMQGIVHHFIVDASTGMTAFDFGRVVENYKVGDYKERFPVALPETLKPGNYIYQVNITYQPGWPWRQQVVRLPPLYFRIVQ